MIPSQTSHSPYLGPGVTGPLSVIPQADVAAAQPCREDAHYPLCGGPPCAVNPKDAQAGIQHTQHPYVTGASVIAFAYKEGVVMACDTLGAYGSTKRYKDVQRIVRVNQNCAVGASGEVSDFQYIVDILQDRLVMDDFLAGDGIAYSPRQVHAYLQQVLYHRRNKFDPLWNSLVVVGMEGDKPFIGMVSMIGNHFTDSMVCTGLGAHLSLPLLREAHTDELTEAEAVELMQRALKVCVYRDKDSINKFVMARVNKEGVAFSAPFAVQTKWDYERMLNPSAISASSW